MIKKLDPIKHTENLYGKNGFITNVACGGVVIKKVNELIDTVNELGKDMVFLRKKVLELGYKEPQTRPENVHPDAESRPENVQDEFAEQRKWIGKLCKFKDRDYKNDQWDYGLLQAVANAETAHIWKAGCFKHNHGHWYDYCEPVKDDVIYKGE